MVTVETPEGRYGEYKRARLSPDGKFNFKAPKSGKYEIRLYNRARKITTRSPVEIVGGDLHVQGLIQPGKYEIRVHFDHAGGDDSIGARATVVVEK